MALVNDIQELIEAHRAEIADTVRHLRDNKDPRRHDWMAFEADLKILQLEVKRRIEAEVNA